MKNQNTFFFIMLTICVCIVFISCKEKIPPTPLDLKKENLIPKPVSLEPTGSSFALKKNTKIIVNQDLEEFKKVGKYLASKLNPATSFDLPINYSNKTPTSGNIYLKLSKDNPQLGKEGYQLSITEEMITLEANDIKGIFYGIQTLRQLLPVAIESTSLVEQSWEIASGTIIDYPNYEYRGAMLDVSRHFYEVEEVKQFIDWLARFKMNVLHLHLSDDQGWRIEIKKWPNLTVRGGSTAVGGGKGGFFTQEQFTDLVNYAKDRYIMIVPEIDMPGHTNAALASYAELNCDNKRRELYTGMKVGFSTLCTRKDIVYEFVEDVIQEIAAISPSPYFHIGGDESHSTKTKDYIYFVDRVQKIVNKHGKQMMGWDDIVAAKLNKNTIAQHWSKTKNAVKAVDKKMKIVMSPASKAYLDMKYDSTTTLGLNWAGFIEVNTGYVWDPATLIPEVKKENIIGIECPLWTETATNMDEVEYLVFPRLLGYAEIGWSQQKDRNWEDYKIRLSQQAPLFEAMNLNFYPSKLVPWKNPQPTKTIEKN